MKSSPKPVDQAEYDDDWIASAWGEAGNQSLLNKGTIKPRPRVKRAIDLTQLSAELKVLDIACGRGEVPAIICQNKGYAIGLDYSESSIKFASQVKAVHDQIDQGRIELTRGDATRLPFADGVFDRVTMLDIIEHLYPEQLNDMFKEVNRVLKPNGYAVIHTLPNRWLYDVTYPLLHKLYSRIPLDPRGPFEKKIHINEQDLPALSKTLSHSGLNFHIWLEQHIPAQARWNAGKDQYHDTRDNVYPLLARWPGKVLEMLSLTPLKLLLCNDIYGVLWKEKKPDNFHALPKARIEKLACRL